MYLKRLTMRTDRLHMENTATLVMEHTDQLDTPNMRMMKEKMTGQQDSLNIRNHQWEKSGQQHMQSNFSLPDTSFDQHCKNYIANIPWMNYIDRLHTWDRLSNQRQYLPCRPDMAYTTDPRLHCIGQDCNWYSYWHLPGTIDLPNIWYKVHH